MIYGYARCSTNESKQDINRQVRELKDAGAEKIFLEYEHRDSLIKKELESLFSLVVAGDTIVVTEVTRLAGSTKQLCEVLDSHVSGNGVVSHSCFTHGGSHSFDIPFGNIIKGSIQVHVVSNVFHVVSVISDCYISNTLC